MWLFACLCMYDGEVLTNCHIEICHLNDVCTQIQTNIDTIIRQRDPLFRAKTIT